MGEENARIKYFHWKNLGLALVVLFVSWPLEHYLFNIDEKTSLFGSLVFSVLAYFMEASRRLIEHIYKLWEMKARDVWGDTIGNSFANSDREAIQHEIVVKTFLDQFPDSFGQKGFLGHIFLHNQVSLDQYGKWLEQLIKYGTITQYETINLFTPQDIYSNDDAKKVVELLAKLPCRQKVRINVLSAEKLHYWFNHWNPAAGSVNNAEGFAKYIKNEYDIFNHKYGGADDASFKTYHVFDSDLRRRRLYLGEYVVVNRRIAFKYDLDTLVFEFLLGEELIRLYSVIFTHNDLDSMLPSDNDHSKAIKDIEKYLKCELNLE